MKRSIFAAGVSLMAGIAGAAPVIDGRLDTLFYGNPIYVQRTQTQFGDSSLGQRLQANGSEIDAVYARIEDGVLYILLAGNLESNFNKLELFFDTKSGGQNKLRGDNPDVDFNGLNRMGDDGTGNGLIFDAEFDADYWVATTLGDIGGGNYGMFVNYAELLTNGGGVGWYVGQVADYDLGTLNYSNNTYLIRASVDNINAAGVTAGTGSSNGAGVTTGVEVAVPLSALGNPSGNIEVCAFINGGGHDFLSNQLAKGVEPGTGNLGEPRATNLTSAPLQQYFTVLAGEPMTYPSSFSVVTGTLLGGTVSSLLTSDNEQMFILNDEFNTDSDVRLVMGGASESSSKLIIAVEVASSRPNTVFFAKLRNKVTSEFDIVGVVDITLADYESVFEQTTNVGDYVETSGNVTLQLVSAPTESYLDAPDWTTIYDQVRMNVVL